ncbi:MBL fold metallo-hydrolase [uncultured Clostridium sp.]|uniref:MBL fold metallo-hydrolase n=1 Tax=uncultured Clostridium sp. TaxID=59620 RepID=UPI0025E75156|nr:MBL fold metallo-hydrolase [uncultured Clostridium sp.]
MKIKWLGHSSFLLQDSMGRTFLTDPFDGTVGYKVFQDKVDSITISHNHFDHNYTKNVKYSHIIDKPGFFNPDGISIVGIPSYHDKVKGAKRGKNIIFVIEMDNYRICHLGDIGYVLSKDEIDKLGKIDVLMIPVGGNFTIDGKEAAILAKSINSHIIIPMHYKTSLLTFELDGLEKFLKYVKNAERVKSNTLVVENNLEKYNLVKILDFK